MPDYGIVDTHLHLWDPGHLRYAWLDSAPSLNRPHLLGDYARATQGVAAERMVFLQCECDVSQFQDEADWVAGLAQADPAFCPTSWSYSASTASASAGTEPPDRHATAKYTRRALPDSTCCCCAGARKSVCRRASSAYLW